MSRSQKFVTPIVEIHLRQYNARMEIVIENILQKLWRQLLK